MPPPDGLVGATLAAVQLSFLAADASILTGTTELRMGDVVTANFFLAGLGGIAAAAAIACVMLQGKRTPAAVLLPAAISLGALGMTSHAAGRLEYRPALLTLTALHQAAAAAWIGALPYLLLALARSGDAPAAHRLCRRFSKLAIVGVVVLAASGIGMSLFYVGSVQALYGTSYGAMVATKAILFAILLLPGGFNYLIVRQHPVIGTLLLPSLRRIGEAEVGIGFTVLLTAASLTSQPPAVDLQYGRVAAAEIAARMSPRWPQLRTPPVGALSPATPLGFDAKERADTSMLSIVPGTSYHPNTPDDIAWSEYNHHWSGLIVLAAGLLALLARGNRVGEALAAGVSRARGLPVPTFRPRELAAWAAQLLAELCGRGGVAASAIRGADRRVRGL